MIGHRARSAGLILVVLSLLQLQARPGCAQTATSGGIDAFVRGDYQRAAQILKPIAERWPGQIDDAASFFMAALYANGLGLPRNVDRACALYSRSSGTGPFARLNAAMFAALQPTLTADEQADCLMLATLGFDHRFEPATFNLDAGHWISIELSSRTQSVSATVTFQGKEKRTDVSAAVSQGVVFLPIRHTELEVGGALPGRRHFIEILTWIPEPTVTRWRLCWSLSEVVRQEVVPIANEVLVTSEGDGPPDRDLVDLRGLVSLRVNAAGAAEWAILAGPNARSEAIATDLERQEVGAELERRKTADDRVDWKQVRDPDRPPSFAYADADGCSEVFVYGWSADRTEVIAIRADKAALQLSTAPRTFDLALHPNEIALSVDVFERPQRNWPFCTDFVVNDGTRRETWKAVAGAVTVQLSPPGVRARQPNQYRVTIQIDTAELVSTTGTHIRQSRPVRLVAIAGGFVGG